ncbi:MAG: arsenic metallochaperone ArsD family protein [Sarcina sp.]|nr:arsenic metallochaperone ArsD family protein [Sarcina sp.]
MKTIIVYDINLNPEAQPMDTEIGSDYRRVSTMLYTLSSRGARVKYLNLHRDALTFMESPVVQQIMRTSGMDGFPCMTTDDQIVVSGRYPNNEEILEQLDAETLELLARPAAGGCNGACSSCHVTGCGSAAAAN